MQKKKTAPSTPLQLGVIYPTAAGIDVGSMSMMVSYPGCEGNPIIQEYGSYTDDLEALALELKQSNITDVCMEATGVYWMSLYELLEQHGFKVTLVNARHYKNVDGQKTDVKDCQWLQQLHAHGLLRASHIAEEEYRELRTYLRERGIMQVNKSDTLNRIHKVLTQMNIKVQHLISDIEGATGMQIIGRIAEGKTIPSEILQGLKTERLKASTEDLEKSLKGIFKPCFIRVLQLHLEAYRFYKQQMKRYEVEIEKLLKKLLPPNAPKIKSKTTKARKNQYHFNLKEYLHHMAGVDLTQIDGLDENSVLTIISVVGLNMNKWRTGDHFTSWLNLSPRPKKSGGMIIGHQKRFTNNAATQAFRLAAQTMWQQKGQLGHLYRKLAHTKGSRKAIKAVARRLALIFYNMLKNQTSYDRSKIIIDEEKLKARKIARLKREAEKLGCRIESLIAC